MYDLIISLDIVYTHETIITVKIRDISIATKIVLLPFCNLTLLFHIRPSFPSPPGNHSFCLCHYTLYHFHILDFYVNRIIQYVSFFISELFHLAYYFRLPMMLCISIVHFYFNCKELFHRMVMPQFVYPFTY